MSMHWAATFQRKIEYVEQTKGEWKAQVLSVHPGAQFEPHGKQMKYATTAIIPATWDRGVHTPSKIIAEFVPEMVRGAGLYLPSPKNTGHGWIEQ